MTEDLPQDSSVPASELLRRVIEQLNKAEAETDPEGTQPSELLRQLIAQLADETAAVEARAAELEATLNAGTEPPAGPEPTERAPDPAIPPEPKPEPTTPAEPPAEPAAELPQAGPLAALAAEPTRETAHAEPAEPTVPEELPAAGPLAAIAAEPPLAEQTEPTPGKPSRSVRLDKPAAPEDAEGQPPIAPEPLLGPPAVVEEPPASPVGPAAPEPEPKPAPEPAPEPVIVAPVPEAPPQSPLVVVMNNPQQTVEEPKPKPRNPLWWLLVPAGCLLALCLLLGILAAVLAITGKGQEIFGGVPFIGVDRSALVVRITKVAKLAPNGQRETNGQNVFGADNRGMSVQVQYVNVPIGYQGQIITQWDRIDGTTATPLRAPEFISITETYNQTTWWYSYRAPTGLPPGQYRFTLAVVGLNSQQTELGSARFEIRGAAPPNQQPVNPTTPPGPPAGVPTVAFHTPTPYPSPPPRRTATPLPGNAPTVTPTPARPATSSQPQASPTPYVGPGGRRP